MLLDLLVECLEETSEDIALMCSVGRVSFQGNKNLSENGRCAKI